MSQKNETLSELKEYLIQIKKETNDSKSKPKINKLIHMLQRDEILDEGWEQFMLHFNDLHSDFLKRLKNAYSELSPKGFKTLRLPQNESQHQRNYFSYEY